MKSDDHHFAINFLCQRFYLLQKRTMPIMNPIKWANGQHRILDFRKIIYVSKYSDFAAKVTNRFKIKIKMKN